MAIRSKTRGTINFDNQVHNQTGRDSATNYYGSSDLLGKSRLELYQNNFNHQNAITRVNEKTIIDRYFNGRDSLIDSNGQGNFNPDFPHGSVNYNYSSTVGLLEIKFNADEESSVPAGGGLKSRPEINTAGSNQINSASDLPGKYVPNLDTDKLNFNGEVTQPVIRRVPAVNNSGFGSDVEINIEERASAFSVNDVHNTNRGTTQRDVTDSRGNSSSRTAGVLNITEEGSLGGYYEVPRDDGGYDDSTDTVIFVDNP